MKKMKKCVIIVICLVITFFTVSCNQMQQSQNNEEEQIELKIAYQYGLAYTPLIIAQQQSFIEEAYREKTGKDINITWVQMSSGADINVGITSGELDAGFMGIAPAITGISKKAGYKIFTNLSGQEHGFMVNDESVNGFQDIIGSDKQIALVNIGSIQHILLGQTLVSAGYDAHALDSNLVAMKHPDGMAALKSGGVVGHITSNPYIYMEREDSNLHEIENMPAVCPKENSFIVGILAESIHEKKPDVYDALCDGIARSIDYINADYDAAAEITCEFDGNSFEDEVKYLKLGNYSVETKGILDLAKFMYENDFIETDPGKYENLVFDNVVGD